MINLGAVSAEGLANEHLLQKIGWQMVNLPLETRNAFLNHVLLECGNNPAKIPELMAILEHLFKNPGRVYSMEACPKDKGPIVVVGSGSSLDPIVPTLKDWKGKVICSTSQASTLIYYGRTPDYIVCMDPRIAKPDKELDCPDFGDAVMLTHPSVPFEYISRWLMRARGRIYLGRIMEPTYDWYSHHLGQGYPWVRHVMLPMIDSVAAEIGMASWLGYNPIYLAGVDYGGPRFQRFDWDPDLKQWVPDTVTSGYVAPQDGNYSGMTAAGAMSYSSRGALMSSYMQMANPRYRQRVYNLSPVSVLRQFPLLKWEDVLAGAEPPEWPDEQRQAIFDDIEMALASWDTYLVPVNSGWGVDYHTYIAKEEAAMVQVMLGYNNQVANNRRNFAAIEKQHKRPLLGLMRDGMVSVEAGDLLLRGADEFGDWDWKQMQEIDVGRALTRRRWLLDEGAKRGYKKPEGAMVKATKTTLEMLRKKLAENPDDKKTRFTLEAVERGDVAVGPTGEVIENLPDPLQAMVPGHVAYAMSNTEPSELVDLVTDRIQKINPEAKDVREKVKAALVDAGVLKEETKE